MEDDADGILQASAGRLAASMCSAEAPQALLQAYLPLRAVRWVSVERRDATGLRAIGWPVEGAWWVKSS